MSYANMFKELEGLEYVVQRNWDHLPDGGVAGHDDVDLFASEKDFDAVQAIASKYPLVDVRHPLDYYYPNSISAMLLIDRRQHNGIWVPSPQAHFISLYYHNAVHKTGDPYGAKLRDLFLKLFPAVRCTDDGVGYNP